MIRSIRVLMALMFAVLLSTSLMATSVSAAEDLAVSGTVSGGGAFAGTILDADFEIDEHAFADYTVTGTLVGTAEIGGASVDVEIAVDGFAYIQDGTTCDEIRVLILELPIDDQGNTVQLDTVVFQAPERDLIGGLLGGGNGLGCELDELLGGNDVTGLLELVDDILDELGY